MTWLAAPSVGAEAPLTWKEAVAIAQKEHPDLTAAREKWNASKAQKSITASAFFPQISANLSADRSQTPHAATATAAAGHTISNAYAYDMTGQQLLFNGFKTYYDVEQAVENIEADRYNYEVTSSNVRLTLRTAFVDLLKAQAQLALTESIVDRRRQSEELINLRYEAGREHKGSLMTAQANLAQASFEVEQAKRNLVLSERRLASALGRSTPASFEAKGDLNAVFTEDKPDIEKLAATNPLLQQLVVLKEAAKWGVKSSVADFFPSVYATGSIGKTGPVWPPQGTDWTVGASVSMPLFEGGSRVAEVAQSKSLLGEAEANEKSGRNGVLLTLEEAWDAFRDAVEQVAVQKKFLNAADERENIAQAEYSAGLITFNDWIIIEDNFVNAEKSYLNAQATALLDEAAWRQAKGETLDEA